MNFISVTEKGVNQMQLSEAQEILLSRITAKANEEADRNYREGELDFIPEKWTAETMLDVVLTKYAMNYYPELLESTQGE